MMIQKANGVHWFWSFLITILTFGTFNTDLFPGIDPSYQWALNHLFAVNGEQLSELNFQFGPLGFLLFPKPIGNNLAIGMAFYSLLKVSFAWLCISTCRKNHLNRFVTLFLTIVLCSIAGVPLMFFGICAFLILYSMDEESFWIYVAIIFAVMGLFIKSSIGIICLTMIGTHVLLKLYFHRNTKQFILILATGVVSLMIFSVWLLSEPFAFITYLKTVIRLSGAYSSSFSQFPDNNWILLSAFLLIMIVGVINMRQRWHHTFWPILLLPLFATWKHAMGREDPGHYYSLIYFTILYWILLIIHARFGRIKLVLAMVICIGLAHANYEHIWGKRNYDFIHLGMSAFQQQIFHHDELKRKAMAKNDSVLNQLKLKDEILQYIDHGTLDVYPWQLMYVPANQFNWLPRSTLQSLTFSSWYDAKSVASWQKNHPEFMLWHWTKDTWGGNFGSIDRRYQLNDEPQTMNHVLQNYECAAVWRGGAVLQKRDVTADLLTNVILSTEIQFDQWVQLPEANGILKGELTIQSSIFGELITFLYKEPPLYITYQLENGQEYTYRFLRSAATDGIWLSPYKRQLLDEYEERVSAIKISTDADRHFEKFISMKFYSQQFSNEAGLLQSFIKRCKSCVSNDKYLFLNTLDSTYWTNVSQRRDSLGALMTTVVQQEHERSKILYVQQPVGQAATVQVNLEVSEETLPSDAELIVSAISSQNAHFWKSTRLQVPRSEEQGWYSISFRVEIPDKNAGDQLRIYVNTKEHQLLYRNLSVELSFITNNMPEEE